MFRSACVICQKEFKGFLFSPGYFITMCVFLVIACFVYLVSFHGFIDALQRSPMNPFGGGPMNFHNAVVFSYINFINLLLIFLTPVIIARIISEDKKLYSFDLLMTSPLNSVTIISGKFLGGLSAIWLIVFIAMLYPLSASFFFDIQWGKFASAFFGLFLIAAIYTSAAFFCSSFTDSFAVAIISGFILNISFLIISALSTFYTENQNLVEVLEYISLSGHISRFTEGNLELSSVVFCVSMILFFCFLSERIIESSRWRG